LFEPLTISRGNGSYLKLIGQIEKAKLLNIGDWGLETLTQRWRNDLLEIMEDHHGSKPTTATTQLEAFFNKLYADLFYSTPVLTRGFCHYLALFTDLSVLLGNGVTGEQ